MKSLDTGVYAGNLAYIGEIGHSHNGDLKFLDIVRKLTKEVSSAERVVALDALGRAIGVGHAEIDHESGGISLTDSGTRYAQDFIDRVHS